jgi:tRNA-Thr(GGU) m(6)t(6)A37 methyltransferase TsaA
VETLTLRPIGFVRSAYAEPVQAPRQPGADDGGGGESRAVGEALIELVGGLDLEQAVADLVGFDRIWAIVWFDRNTTWRTRVLPPRGGRTKRSVLATRSPHRPNPIGLSALRLLEVRGRTLRVGEVDLLDGTPVLDLKPYIPYADAFPDARAGWVDEIERAQAEGAAVRFEIAWSSLATEQAAWLRERHGVVVGEAAARALERDPAPHPYRRILRSREGELLIAEKSWRLFFVVEGARVTITRVGSGYRVEALRGDPASLLDGLAHVAFQSRWPRTKDDELGGRGAR